MLQLQMLQMQQQCMMGQLMQQLAQTQQQNWDMGSRNGMGMPSIQNMQHQHRYPGEGRRERGCDAGGYRRDNHGRQVQGPSKRNVEINKQITVCQDSRDLCALIDAHAAEFNPVNVATAFRRLLQMWRGGRGARARGVVERSLQALEEAALRTINVFGARELANTMHAMAKAHYTPTNPLVLEALEQQTEAVAGTLNAQEVANTLWAYATMGWEPGAGLMRKLEGRAEAVAGTFNAQDVANTLWAYATMGREPGAGMMRSLEGRAEALAGQ